MSNLAPCLSSAARLAPFFLPAKAIDQYIAASSASDASGAPAAEPDPRLKTIVDQMFSRCIADKEYKQALGIALETRRLDIIEEVFNLTRDQALLGYVLEAVMGVVQTLDLRNKASFAFSSLRF